MVDVQNTLKHKMSGIMAVWAYMNGGRAPLERLFKQKGYHGEREREFIETFAKKLANDPEFPKDNISLIDLGHGEAVDKAKLFMDSFNRVANDNLRVGEEPHNRFVEAIGIDIVPDYSATYVDEISKYFNYIARGDEAVSPVRCITKEYSKITRPVETKGTPVMMTWNTPLWNAPIGQGDMNQNEILPKALKYAARIVDQDGYIVMNHYLHSDEDQALYESDDCRQAIGAILHLIEKEIAPECYVGHESADDAHDVETREKIPFSKCFEYKTYYDKENGTRRMDVVSRLDVTIKIGDHFYKTMNEGESFCFVPAAKLTQSAFDMHVQQAGIFNKVYSTSNSDDTIVGQALKVSRRPQV